MGKVWQAWKARALLYGGIALLLQQVSVPYVLRVPGANAADASLIHLHAGFMLAVAMLDRNRRALLVSNLILLGGWLVRAWIRDYSVFAMLLGTLNAILVYVWLLLCVRWMGWPRWFERQRVERVDIPRMAAIGLLVYPAGLVVSWAIFGLGSEWSEQLSDAIQMLFAKHFGVAIVAFPLVVAWTERHRRAEPVTAVRLRWALMLTVVMFCSLWVSRAVPQLAGAVEHDIVLMDYRLTLFAAVAWSMIHLRPLYSMPLLAAAMFALVESLGRTAEYGATPLGFVNLIHLAVESSLLMMAMLYIRVSDRDAREFSERLVQESRLDAVTRLPNLNAIKHRLEVSPPARREMACLLLDKTDSLAPGFGLATQTRLMNRVATQLADLVEPYYIGTSQFALLPRDDADANVWQRLIERVEQLELESDNQAIRLLPYLGVAECEPKHPGGVDRALMMASSLAYEARRRNELHPLYASEAGVSPRQEQRLLEAAEALACLRSERVVLYFQPIRALSAAAAKLGEATIHGEVLCRLRKADGSLLRPEIFMRAIEGAGRGVELDLAVLRALFAWLQQHPQVVDRTGMISVNLTGQSLTSAGFGKQLLAMLEDSPLPLSRLCFEIIETAAIVSPTETNAFLGELRRRGCSIAIDDFGIGMQSFERLKKLPVDIIKIDGSFIRNVAQRGKDHALVQASIAVARAFGAMTVAEYVEDEATMACLRELGVDWVQGFLISEPVPIEDAFGVRH